MNLEPRSEERLAPVISLEHRRQPEKRRVTSLGPHGESAASPDQLAISDEKLPLVQASSFRVGMVMHTTSSDWSQLQIAGVEATLEEFGSSVIEVIGCDFRADRQVRALEALIERRPDAIISIPVDNVLTATAHRLVTHAGIKLVLMDNAPIGMLPGKDYVSLVSADNFGNGQVAASILSDDILEGGVVGIIGFGVDFFVTNEREIAFRKWLRQYRPDVRVEHAEFPDIESAGDVAVDFLEGHGDIDGLFVVWDEPAIQVVNALRETGQELPITTIDLGNEAAVEIAGGGLIKGVGAQQPYDQGAAEAMAAIMALVGEQPPPWVALPSLSVTKRNVLSAYEAVWHTPAPNELRGVIESAT